MGKLLIDIGGTAIKYGWYENGTWSNGVFPVHDPADSVGQDGPMAERLPEKLADLVSRYHPEAIGVSAPGPFDYESGTGMMTTKLLSLSRISLRTLFEQDHPGIPILFLHDAVAFYLGAREEIPSLAEGRKSVVMLGTGLGYLTVRNGRVRVNESQTPASKLWNQPYRSEYGEYYVSASALLRRAGERGYAFSNVKEMAIRARSGDRTLLSVFRETGMILGELLKEKQKADGFTEYALGGGVSCEWDLMREGYDEVCSIPYRIISDPMFCAVKGMLNALALGKERIYLTN